MIRHSIAVGFFLLIPSITMAAPMIYIPTGNTNNILIVDLETDKIVGRIDELENAHGLSSSPNSDYLVAGSMKPMESTGSSMPNKPAAVSDAEHVLHHAGNNNKTNNGSVSTSSYLSIVHPEHGHVMNRIAVRALTHHTTVSPNGKFAVAVHSGAGGISVVDIDKKSVLTTIDTGLWANYAIFTNDGNRLYVSNAGANTVSEIDTTNWQIVREFKAGKQPEHMVLGTENRMLYVANKGDASAIAINLSTGKTSQTYPVGNTPHGIDISDNGRWLFVASKAANRITRIDLNSGERKTIELKPAPYHLAYIKNFNKFYVSSRKQPVIWVLDSETLKVKSTIDLKQGVAHQMAIRD